MQFESFRAIVHVLTCTFNVSWNIERDGENTKVYSGSMCFKQQRVTDKHDEKHQKGELSRRKFVFPLFTSLVPHRIRSPSSAVESLSLRVHSRSL